jgi:hypothetical protein
MELNASRTSEDLISLQGSQESLWGIPEIAKYLNKGLSSARKYAADPNFPTPVMDALRDRRWFPDEVIAYFRTERRRDIKRPSGISKQLIPHRITTKPKKAKAA